MRTGIALNIYPHCPMMCLQRRKGAPRTNKNLKPPEPTRTWNPQNQPVSQTPRTMASRRPTKPHHIEDDEEDTDDDITILANYP